MMTKGACMVGLVVLTLLVGSAEVRAQSSQGFSCQIDLQEIVDELPEGTQGLQKTYGTSRQLKVCQGRNNVRISCDGFIPDWPFNERLDTSDLTCCINTKPCGITNEDQDENESACGTLAEAETASLRIISTQSSLCGPDSTSCGFARLDCRLNDPRGGPRR